MNTITPIPQGFTSLTPHLIVDNAIEAIEFYKQAFNAVEIRRITLPNQPKILHAELQIGNAILMICDDFGAENHAMHIASPLHSNTTAVALHLYVEDADAVFAQAMAAGCIELKPVMEMFWGDRFAQIRDPYGHIWTLASRVRNVSAEEIQTIANAIFAPQS